MPKHLKILVIRVSSLGDVILATSSLEVVRNQPTELDWIVADEYAALLQGHPRIRKLWTYNRATGLWGWLALCRLLRSESYDQVIDLHGSLRSRILRYYFRCSSLTRKLPKRPQWKAYSKQRVRLFGYFALKALWPKAWRPAPVVKRFSLAAGGDGSQRPNLAHILAGPKDDLELPVGDYLCVMPSSTWEGKKWPLSRFVELVRGLPVVPVILGAKQDQDSYELCRILEAEGLPHLSGVGRWSLRQTARVLAGSRGYIGNDTGLSHLAEALGVQAHVLFGPTVPDMGFGPWKVESRTYGTSLWCRPCGKDGRYCFRVTGRFRCLSDLEPQKIALSFQEEGGLR
jgi:ADP-heptose:LPS heptosyltransferase